MRRLLLIALVPAATAACGGDSHARRAPATPITVYAAASLARPLRLLADSFTASTGIVVRPQLGGSMELSRRVTDLAQTPDVLLLVDDRTMAALLPSHADWYARFATNRIVVAYTDASRHGDSITADNWWRVLSRNDVDVGRADSATAPAGRQALAILRDAAAYYRVPDLTARLLARTQEAFVRSDAAQLATLLETGEVDYVLDYESLAEQYGFRHVALPRDLAVDVVYTASVPRGAPEPESATEFVSYLLSNDGRRVLRSTGVTVLPVPVAVGTHLPSRIADRVRTIQAAAAAP